MVKSRESSVILFSEKKNWGLGGGGERGKRENLRSLRYSFLNLN